MMINLITLKTYGRPYFQIFAPNDMKKNDQGLKTTFGSPSQPKTEPSGY